MGSKYIFYIITSLYQKTPQKTNTSIKKNWKEIDPKFQR